MTQGSGDGGRAKDLAVAEAMSGLSLVFGNLARSLAGRVDATTG